MSSEGQPIPDWSDIQNDPRAFNVRCGIFWCVQTLTYDVYLIDGLDGVSNEKFDTLPEALDALNNYQILKDNNTYKLKKI